MFYYLDGRPAMDSSSFRFVLLLLSSLAFPSSSLYALAEESNSSSMSVVGGLRDNPSCGNSLELDDLGRFAITEHNKKQNTLLEFGKVVKAQKQVVAGTLHHLTIEAVSGGKKMFYEAKIWVKPWLDYKVLQDFKQVDDASSITPADLGVKEGGHDIGLKTVSVQDPAVVNAAKHAIESIQKKSNSLIPYELQEILHAKAEVINMSAKFEMLLKVKWGEKYEKMKVEVHKNEEGVLNLNRMEQDHT